MRDKEKPTGARRVERREISGIESYNSPKTKHTDENAGIVFSAFVFIVAFIVVVALGYLVSSAVNIWVLSIAVVVAVLAIFTIHIAPQWEKAVILRLGKYVRTAGPGFYLTIPFIEHIALKADQRIMLTGFGAEETLTADLVPVNVDAVVFWLVWDAEKACVEVEDYYDSVSLAAQTALRNAIGRKSIAEVAMQRVQLDEELQEAIEEKTSTWGVSILFVEIRDVVIPKELQDDMAAEAKAEREKDARIVLAEVEKDIAVMLQEATKVYREDELAFRLRSMHLLSEGIKGSQGTIVIPSAYAEGFTDEAIRAAQPSKPRQ
jgi:regulator of protease activity HflC (stomatin/prohibitin superfamily)